MNPYHRAQLGHLENSQLAARQASASALRGHRPGIIRRPVTTTAPQRISRERLEVDLSRLLSRHPKYRTDGTEAMLREWIVTIPQQARWFIDHCV